MQLENIFRSNYRKRPASYLVAVHPGGRVFEIEKRNGAYWWDYGKGSYPLSAVRENLAEIGGHVERRFRSDPR